MLKRFRHKGLETLFLTGSAKGVDAGLAPKLRRMLALCPAGPSPLPGYRLHQLKASAPDAGRFGRPGTLA